MFTNMAKVNYATAVQNSSPDSVYKWVDKSWTRLCWAVQERVIFSIPFFVKKITFVAPWNHLLLTHFEFGAGRESPCVTVFHTHKKNRCSMKTWWSQKGDERTGQQVSLFHPVTLGHDLLLYICMICFILLDIFLISYPSWLLLHSSKIWK